MTPWLLETQMKPQRPDFSVSESHCGQLGHTEEDRSITNPRPPSILQGRGPPPAPPLADLDPPPSPSGPGPITSPVSDVGSFPRRGRHRENTPTALSPHLTLTDAP